MMGASLAQSDGVLGGFRKGMRPAAANSSPVTAEKTCSKDRRGVHSSEGVQRAQSSRRGAEDTKMQKVQVHLVAKLCVLPDAVQVARCTAAAQLLAARSMLGSAVVKYRTMQS